MWIQDALRLLSQLIVTAIFFACARDPATAFFFFHSALRPQKPQGLLGTGRRGGGGKGVWRWGKREIIYLELHCHHQNDSCIKMGSGESHFNVSVGSDGQSHKTVSTNHNLFEEKGEPKRYRTEVLPLTSLKPVLNWANVSSRT